MQSYSGVIESRGFYCLERKMIGSGREGVLYVWQNVGGREKQKKSEKNFDFIFIFYFLFILAIIK